MLSTRKIKSFTSFTVHVVFFSPSKFLDTLMEIFLHSIQLWIFGNVIFLNWKKSFFNCFHSKNRWKYRKMENSAIDPRDIPFLGLQNIPTRKIDTFLMREAHRGSGWGQQGGGGTGSRGFLWSPDRGCGEIKIQGWIGIEGETEGDGRHTRITWNSQDVTFFTEEDEWGKWKWDGSEWTSERKAELGNSWDWKSTYRCIRSNCLVRGDLAMRTGRRDYSFDAIARGFYSLRRAPFMYIFRCFFGIFVGFFFGDRFGQVEDFVVTRWELEALLGNGELANERKGWTCNWRITFFVSM